MKNTTLLLTLLAASGLFASQTMAQPQQGPGGPRHQQMLEQFDANGDGQLDQTERNAARQAMILKRFDADKDGQLSADEQAKADAHHQKMLERFDTNGDGQISIEERMAGQQGKKSAGKGGPGSKGPKAGDCPCTGGKGGPQGGQPPLPYLED